MKIDTSGIIPLCKINGEWKVFLIQYRDYEQFWGCPKGHLQPNESHLEAAGRELTEETGLDIKRLIANDPILEEFYWFKKGERTLKRILFFIAEVRGHICLQKEEIVAGQWFSIPEAIHKILHPEGKATLKKMMQILLFHEKFN